MSAKSILIIEDEHALGSALSLLVTRMGHRAELVASAEAGWKAFESGAYSAAVIDIGLPDQSGLEILEKIRGAGSNMPVLIVTAHATLEHALESQKQRATAYMNKPLDMEELKVQLGALLEPTMAVVKTCDEATETDPISLIGAAPCLRDVFIGIARATTGDFPVLVSGPSGSGKSLTARLILKHGAQASGVVHEFEGAALDSWEPQPEWDGGNVIIDDLTAVKPAVQSSISEWLHSDADSVRILATMAGDPSEAVEVGTLREDLYFAFKPGWISMPPLSERSSDIPVLCHFFAGISKREGDVPEITTGAMTALQSHDWPGNVRELKHVLDYAISMSKGGPIFLSHLPESFRLASPIMETNARLGTELELAIQRWVDQELQTSEEVTYDKLLQRLEKELLQHLMQHFQEKPTRLAEALKIHRGTLRQKLQRIDWERTKS